MKDVLGSRVEIKSAALLKNSEKSLLNDLQKIKGVELEIAQKITPISSKAGIQLER